MLSRLSHYFLPLVLYTHTCAHIPSPPDQLTTQRLSLHAITRYKDTELDTLALQLFTACPQAVRKTLFCGNSPGPWSTAKARQSITFWRNSIAKRCEGKKTLTLWKYFLFLPNTDTMIGSISFHTPQADDCWKIGYWLSPGQQGKGYITEAAQALISFYFALTNAPRLYACVPDIDGTLHKKSAQVCTRLGFVEEVSTTPRPLGCPCPHKFVLSAKQFLAQR
ncbi:MAG: GNAT family N-acetyltransferase [Epsilonproteobacteria bacterium]|nr:GNAT family N-acetyltransferase [Campylobacterota bacterium]